jgi:hypothetical protein
MNINRAQSWSQTKGPSWSDTRAPSWSQTRVPEVTQRHHSPSIKRRVEKSNSLGSKNNYEPREFAERSQHQYVGIYNTDDSDSIDMETYLNYQI